MKSWWKVAFGILCGLLGGGLIYLVSSPPRGAPLQLLPLPSPAPIQVHVAGAVIHPGVYSLPAGSRLEQAIQAAGGAASSADLQALNLAALLEDGSQLLVPTKAPLATATPNNPQVRATDLPTQASDWKTPTPTVTFPININTATLQELDALPYIGQIRASEIIAYRQEHGPFKRIEDLLKVYGITQEVFDRIKDLITVST
jgi:competence protein ComEA